jgi:hypothetical protein
MTPTTTLDELLRRATKAMHAYYFGSSDRGIRGGYARQAAEAIVEARGHFHTRDGTTDVGGRSWEYRQFLAAAYDAAGIPKERRAGIQAAIRYHVSPVLREMYPDDIEDLGMRREAIQDVSRDKRKRDRDILALFVGGGEVTDPHDISEIANTARYAVSRISGFEPGTTPTRRARIREEVDNLATAVQAVADKLK